VVVRDDDECAHELAPQRLEQVADHAGRVVVEVASRLVGEEQARLVGDSSSDGDPLSFAAGQLAGTMIDPMRQADPIKKVSRPRPPAARAAATRQHQRQLHVLERRQGSEEAEMLEDEADRAGSELRHLVTRQVAEVFTADRYGPLLRALETADDRQQRRLARSGRSDESDVFTFSDLERDVDEDRDGVGAPLPVSVAELLDADTRDRPNIDVRRPLADRRGTASSDARHRVAAQVAGQARGS
jgi:hypothetical protein